jgi:hypothetical protein
MARTILCDSFTWFILLSVGLMFVAVLLTRGNGRPPTGVAERIGIGLRSSATSGGNGRPPTGVIERGVGRLPGRPDRIANRVLGRLTETGSRCGPTGVRESDIPGLEGYARQFEEAIEQIRLSHQGSRGRGER